MKQYDYLIVGAGLFGAVFAHEAKKAGKKCLVIDFSCKIFWLEICSSSLTFLSFCA